MVRSTIITLTIPNGDNDVEEEDYSIWIFQFSLKGRNVTRCFACRSVRWKHKNLVLADPGKFLLDVKAN
jgi:hypothetical protein